MKITLNLFACISLLLAASSTLADSAHDTDTSQYVVSTRAFTVPESFNYRDVEQCRLLVKVNPSRYEAHALLAIALAGNGQLDEAIESFEKADEASFTVKDPELIAQIPYEDVYTTTLLAVAVTRCANDGGDLKALRILQRALGMGEAHLLKTKQLSKCYTMMAHIQLRRGFFDKAIDLCEKGIEAAKSEGKDEMIPLLEDGISKAKQRKARKDEK